MQEIDLQLGIYDDGDFVTWDEINDAISRRETQERFPFVKPEVVYVFADLIGAAERYRELTGRYLQIWGELGELAAEIVLGIRRHRPHAQGSDGKLGDEFVEIKTLSPERIDDVVEVPRAKNFSKLCLVRIGPDFSFQLKLIARSALNKGNGGSHVRVRWSTAVSEQEAALDLDDGI